MAPTDNWIYFENNNLYSFPVRWVFSIMNKAFIFVYGKGNGGCITAYKSWIKDRFQVLFPDLSGPSSSISGNRLKIDIKDTACANLPAYTPLPSIFIFGSFDENFFDDFFDTLDYCPPFMVFNVDPESANSGLPFFECFRRFCDNKMIHPESIHLDLDDFRTSNNQGYITPAILDVYRSIEHGKFRLRQQRKQPHSTGA